MIQIQDSCRRLAPALLLAAAITAPGLAGETYYVRTSGDDTNSGLAADDAFATIQHAVAQCDGAGHTVYVGPGTYFEEVLIGEGAGQGAADGTLEQPNSIIGDVTGTETGDPAGPAVIDGMDQSTYGLRIRERDHWMLANLTFSNQASIAVSTHEAGDVVVADCVIDAPPQYALFAFRGSGLSVLNNTLERDDASGHGLSFYNCGGNLAVSGNRMSMTGDLYHSTPWKDGVTGWQGANMQVADAVGIAVWLDENLPSMHATIENNILSDYYMGIYANTYGGQTSVRAVNNSSTGCRYFAYGIAFMGPVSLSDNISVDSHYGLGVSTYKGTATVSGLLTNNITVESVRQDDWGDGTFEVSGIVENQDPLWVMPEYGNFRLRASSAAVDGGLGLQPALADIRGMARPFDGDASGSSEYDLGAYEYDPEADNPSVAQWDEVDPRD